MEKVMEKALKIHEEHKGKIEVISKIKVENKDDLSLVYSPGVAAPCLEIQKNEDKVYDYTSKSNTVAVITDGTAVLGLGDIGPKAALPVMEGKNILFKNFANIDSIPICLDTKDPKEIINIVKKLSPTFGGINLEDISAPRCVEIERELIKELDIPVFHDDQHGTAIVATAALINTERLTGKKLKDLKVVVSGTGAAGSSIIRMLNQIGIKEIYAYNKNGILHRSKKQQYDFLEKELLEYVKCDFDLKEDTLSELVKNKDAFLGVSAKGLLTKEMVKSMNKKPYIFAMANPIPEIMPEEAKEAGAYIIGTGRSDYPNQVNNVLAFPGIFRGALDSRAKKITEEMKLEAARAIAYTIEDEKLNEEYIIPSPFDKNVCDNVAKAIIKLVKGA